MHFPPGFSSPSFLWDLWYSEKNTDESGCQADLIAYLLVIWGAPLLLDEAIGFHTEFCALGTVVGDCGIIEQDPWVRQV
jgi:hypothetical protein